MILTCLVWSGQLELEVSAYSSHIKSSYKYALRAYCEMIPLILKAIWQYVIQLKAHNLWPKHMPTPLWETLLYMHNEIPTRKFAAAVALRDWWWKPLNFNIVTQWNVLVAKMYEVEFNISVPMKHKKCSMKNISYRVTFIVLCHIYEVLLFMNTYSHIK